MSIVLEKLLASISSNQSKWLIAVIFVFLSLPVLLPLLFLCSFLAFMLLLPLGCALVGLLSWQRLRQPAAAYPAPIRDEKQEKQTLVDGVEESDSSASDAESIQSDYKDIAEVYQSKDLEELLCPHLDIEVESLTDNTANSDTIDDCSGEAALISTKLNVQGYDVVEELAYLSYKQECLSDKEDHLSDHMLVNVDQTALSNEQEEVWFQEMQLELEKYEMFRACDDAYDHRIDWIDTAVLHDVQHVDCISASDASSCSKNGAKRGKASSISSLLSTGSGSISMTSTVCSTSSSSSATWSAWSEESSMNLYDTRRSKKGSNDGRGTKANTSFSARPDRSRVLGSEGVVQQAGILAERGKRVGISAASRGQMGAAQGVRPQARAYVDGGRGRSKASKGEAGEEEVAGAEARRLLSSESTYTRGGAASKGRALAGGRRAGEEEVKQDGTLDSNHYYSKRGNNNNNNTARRSVVAPDLGGAATTRHVVTPRRNVSSSQSHTSSGAANTAGKKNHHVSITRGHVSGSLATSGATAPEVVDDVRKRIVHVNNSEDYGAAGSSPPYAHIHASEYPQLLEFWRGIERAFLQVTTTSALK